MKDTCIKFDDCSSKEVNREVSMPKPILVLTPKQELFYKSLEKWASNMNNPKCGGWIVRYLAKGRYLPFYRLKVFKFKYDLDKAKDFLINMYEISITEQQNKAKIKRKERQDRFYEKELTRTAIKMRSKIDDEIDELIRVAQSSNYTDNSWNYPLGYAGTWAREEAGYTNDDIDTIFDGDPDAYWNID